MPDDKPKEPEHGECGNGTRLRRCSAVWSERTLTATGCDNVSVRRFRRVGKDLRPHDVWLCAACAALRSGR